MNFYLDDYLTPGERDIIPALSEALYQCKKNPGSTLYLGGGERHLYPENACEAYYAISNNDRGVKRIAFPLIGFDGLTVDGEGAELIFHGLMVPFLCDHSKNITVKNLKIDYVHPFYFQAEILEASEDRLLLSYDPAVYTLECGKSKLTFSCPEEGWQYASDRILTTEFDAANHAPSATLPPYFCYFLDESDGSFLAGMYRYVKPTIPEEGRLLMTGHFGFMHTVGNDFVATFSGRECPGFILHESEKILLSDITLYHTPSMGVLAQLCENVTLQSVRAFPREGSGRVLSVNADATHFVNCSGQVTLKDCLFRNMLDDAGNIHGTYMIIQSSPDLHSLWLTFGHSQQQGLRLYRPGDRVRLVNHKTMVPYGEYTVKEAVLVSPTRVRLTLEEEIKCYEPADVVENFSRMPFLLIEGCETGYNRPRGFLVSTCKKAVVRNSTFYNMSHAIHVAGDANDWYESGPVADLEITGNHFTNAAYTGGSVIRIDPRVREGEVPYHRNIRITGNDFTLHEPRFLEAFYTEGLVFKDNCYREDPALPTHEAIENGMTLKACPGAVIEKPKEL